MRIGDETGILVWDNLPTTIVKSPSPVDGPSSKLAVRFLFVARELSFTIVGTGCIFPVFIALEVVDCIPGNGVVKGSMSLHGSCLVNADCSLGSIEKQDDK